MNKRDIYKLNTNKTRMTILGILNLHLFINLNTYFFFLYV